MGQSTLTGTPRPMPAWPRYMPHSAAFALQNSTQMNSAGDRVATIGSIAWADEADHNVSILHWRLGSAGSVNYTLRISLQDIDAATGPVGRPDNTPDQSATHVNPAAGNFSSTLGATRAVAHGAEVGVQWDFSAWTAGTANIAGVAAVGATGAPHSCFMAFFNESAWALEPNIVCLTVESDDGVMGLYVGGLPRISAAINSHVINTGTNPDEVALDFTVLEPQWIGEGGFFLAPAAGADFDLVLYSGDSVLKSKSFDANKWHTDAAIRWASMRFASQAVVAGGAYRLAIKPTTVNSVTVYSCDVSTAAHLAAFGGRFQYNARQDAASWGAATATRLPLAYVGISAVESGGGLTGSFEDTMNDTRQADSVDQSYRVIMRHLTTGALVTGIAHSDITQLHYVRQNAAPVSVAAANLAAINSAHSDGGWEQYDSTKDPGAYRIDMPDAAQVAGVPRFTIVVITATARGVLTVDLTADNPRAAAATTAEIAGAALEAWMDEDNGGKTNAQLLAAGGSFNISIAGGVLTAKDNAGTTLFTRTVTREVLNAITVLAP